MTASKYIVCFNLCELHSIFYTAAAAPLKPCPRPLPNPCGIMHVSVILMRLANPTNILFLFCMRFEKKIIEFFVVNFGLRFYVPNLFFIVRVPRRSTVCRFQWSGSSSGRTHCYDRIASVPVDRRIAIARRFLRHNTGRSNSVSFLQRRWCAGQFVTAANVTGHVLSVQGTRACVWYDGFGFVHFFSPFKKLLF